MNDDNVIDVFDLVLMRQAAVASSTINEDVMTAYIPELDATLEQFILNEYGIDALDEAENLLA